MTHGSAEHGIHMKNVDRKVSAPAGLGGPPARQGVGMAGAVRGSVSPTGVCAQGPWACHVCWRGLSLQNRESGGQSASTFPAGAPAVVSEGFRSQSQCLIMAQAQECHIWDMQLQGG